MNGKITALAGDGIGEEIMQSCLTVLRQVGEIFGHSFEVTEGLVGGAAFDRYGSHFPDETHTLCKDSDAVLFGAVGGPSELNHLPKWNRCEVNSILAIRKAFSFHVNLRPAKVFSELKGVSPLRDHLLEDGVDVLIVRELLGDLYFGEHSLVGAPGARVARDVAEYTEEQIRAAAQVGFEAAMNRRSRLVLADKANVLETSKLWRAVVRELAAKYPSVELQTMYVDNCAMQLVKNPAQFDVILTSNLFGDILSDLAAVLPGSLGLLASTSFNQEGFALYEPPGGSAPDIAGKDLANPIGMILCVAMMLRFSFKLEAEARAVERAVEKVLRNGYRTPDIACGLAGEKAVGTREMTTAIVLHLDPMNA